MVVNLTCLTQTLQSEFGPEERREGPAFQSVFQGHKTQQTHESKCKVLTGILIAFV